MSSLHDLQTLLYTNSIILGPLRVLLLVGFLFLIKRLISLRVSNQVGLDYIVSRYAIIISAIIILSFILTLLNAFDLLSFLIVSFLLILFIFLNLNFEKSIWEQLKKIRKRILIYIVKSFELDKKIISKKNLRKPTDHSKAHQITLSKSSIYWQAGIAIVLGVTTYLYRYYFFFYDNYMLSDLWYREFKILKLLNIQQGFSDQVAGEHALISLYSKITGITEAIALQSFGLLESAILSVIIFWSVYKITRGRYVPALVAALSFIFLFNLLPFNINLITKHSSLYLAMSLAIPVVIYTAEPESLRTKTNSYLKWMFALYFAIAVTNLFVFLIVIPCLLIILLFIVEKQRKTYFFKNAYAYALSLITFSSFYLVITAIRGESFMAFIKQNILIISSYTYTPQLIAPLEHLMTIYLFIALGLVMVFFFLSLGNRQQWRWALAFSSFSALLLSIYYFHFSFVDNDLMHLLATLILPILFGCLVYIFTYFIRSLIAKVSIPKWIKIGITTCIFACIFYYTNTKYSNFHFEKTNPIKSEVLEAYNYISESMLPYTYAVIDDKENFGMSVGSHFFINYYYLNDGYLKQDALYFENRLKKEYLKRNPDIILPPSTLVFVYLNSNSQQTNNLTSQKNKSLEILETLQQRGRKINLFFERPQLKVFEIINEPELSKIEDLLF